MLLNGFGNRRDNSSVKSRGQRLAEKGDHPAGAPMALATVMMLK